MVLFEGGCGISPFEAWKDGSGLLGGSYALALLLAGALWFLSHQGVWSPTHMLTTAVDMNPVVPSPPRWTETTAQGKSLFP